MQFSCCIVVGERLALLLARFVHAVAGLPRRGRSHCVQCLGDTLEVFGRGIQNIGMPRVLTPLKSLIQTLVLSVFSIHSLSMSREPAGSRTSAR